MTLDGEPTAIDGRHRASTTVHRHPRHGRRLRWLAAALALVVASACGDDSSDDDTSDGDRPSAGTGDADTPGEVGGTELVDPEVPLSNVPNQPESPMDPAGPNPP